MGTKHTRSIAMLTMALSVALAAGCGDDPETAGPANVGGSGGGTGGTGGSGGAGGTGGDELTGCDALPLPGAIDEGTWSKDFTIAGVSGFDGVIPSVHDLAVDPAGDLVAAGYFRWIGKDAVGPVVAMRDGAWASLDVDWASEDVPAELGAVAYGPAGEIAVSTHQQKISFTGPEPSGRILLDTGSGMETIATFDGQVRDLAWIDGSLWAVGGFTIRDADIGGLAVWNGSEWSAAPGGAANDSAFTIWQEGETTFVGGSFTRIGGIDANKIAAWDGASWTAHDVDFTGDVFALDRTPEGDLIAAGYVFPAGEEPTSGGIFQQATDGSWSLVGGGVGQGFGPGVVSDLQYFDGELFVSGCFNYLGGDASSEASLFTSQLARWNGTDWIPVESTAPFTAWYDPWPCGAWTARQKMLVHDDILYVAGNFGATGDVASQGLAAYDGESWLPAGASAGHGITGAVLNLEVGGPSCTVYAFGEITHGSGVATESRLLRWDDGWKPVGGERPEGADCRDLEVDGEGNVFVGCTEWPTDGSEPRGRVFRVGETWEPVAEPNELGPIFDLGIDGQDRLWVVGGTMTGYVARLDDDAFTIVESGFDGLVEHIAFEPVGGEEQGVLVAGYFANVGDTAASKIATFDGSAWSGLGDGLATWVTAIAWGETGVFASTAKESEDPNLLLGHWDGSTWTELGTPENGLGAPAEGGVHTFTSLLARGDVLIATGIVQPETGGGNAFVWDGERLTAVGGGIGAMSVEAAAITEDGLWFGGRIAEVGPPDARLPSVGAARLDWTAAQ